MAQGDEQFLKRLLATFQLEAREHLDLMASVLQELRGSPRPEMVEVLFREAHSLKGAARAVNLSEVEQVCQSLESVLSMLKRLAHVPDAKLIGIFERVVDGLESMLAGDVSQAMLLMNLLTTSSRETHLGIVAPEAMSESVAPPAAPLGKQGPPSSMELPTGSLSGGSVRISTARLEALLIQSEELLAFKFGANHLVDELSAVAQMIVEWRRACDKRSNSLRLMRRSVLRRKSVLQGGQVLAQWQAATERDEIALKALMDRFMKIERTVNRDRRALRGMVDKLQDEMRQALMLPFSSLLEMAPKLVRDLGRDCGKDVELIIQDTALEVDRRILEQLKTPLIHLLRNAVDHGIESKDVRRRVGKPWHGRITIDVRPCEGNKVEMVVADDGGGIDVADVKARALKMGLHSAHGMSMLSDEQVLGLVFESGLSTSPILTDLSGHGLGLTIAREKIDKLGGTLTLESQLGRGTRFRVVLPTALATFRGLLIGLGERRFVLPLRNVERVTRVKHTAVLTMENREAIDLDGQAVAMVRLRDVLDLHTRAYASAPQCHMPAVILHHANKRIALVVDEILGDQEVLVKPLRPPLKRVRNVAGATILGEGHVVPLLDVGDLMKSSLNAGAPPIGLSSHDVSTPVRQRSLLVVEDSITSRTLLTGILESAGYLVSSAVDGVDALTMLQRQDVDLIVSDVEMPRLDGFGLTKRIRADKKWAELPVVLVTALGSRQDRERGVEVGANAYIVKSDFDQANLLDVIRSLL